MNTTIEQRYRTQDKRLHFASGVAVGMVAGVFASRGFTPAEAFVIGTATAGFFGVAKKALDAWRARTREGEQPQAERADAVATLAGGVVGAALAAALRAFLE